jgi:peroxiredoxin Q/BCP
MAPDFELAGTEGRFALSAHRGTPVVLLFYPADATPVCTRQFCSYRDRATELAGLGALTVGISRQDLASHARFRDAHALTLPLLADVDGAVARAYGVAGRRGHTKRATFVVDAEGVVRYRHDNPLSLTYDSVDAIRTALNSLRARGH